MEIDNDKSIFKYLNPNGNDKLSLLNGFDHEDMLHYINCYYLELRDNLGFSIDDTFGVEVECEETNNDVIDIMIYEFGLDHWQLVIDTSLFDGIELVSPILRDKKSTWSELITICKIAENNGVIGRNTGGHIHIGTQVLGNSHEVWLNFLKIWAVYENVIFRFLYGEFLTARPSVCKYALPCNKAFLDIYNQLKKKCFKNIRDVIKNILCNKNSAINFQHISFDTFLKGNTIEFRCPNGTFEPVIWQNNINLLVKLLNYCKSDQFNNDIIDRRRCLLNENNMRLEKYHYIYKEEALEFCDLVFDNNLDKIYFLRQYLKSFEVSEGSIGLDEAKCFVKRMH